jgi:hypothetical protein
LSAVFALPALADEPITGSGGGSSGNFALGGQASGGGGNLTLSVWINGYVQPEKRGAVYATRSTLLNRQFAFFIVLETSLTNAKDADYPYAVKVGDERGSIHQSIEVGESSAEFAYSVSAASIAKVDEALTIRGKKVDLTQGRVFICALEKDVLRIKQVKDFEAKGVSSAEAEAILKKVNAGLDEGKLKMREVE